MFLTALTVLGSAGLALAEDAAPKIDSGDTAWMLVATALVLLMTAPGLALFYGGLVRGKNVLSILMQSFILMAVISGSLLGLSVFILVLGNRRAHAPPDSRAG